MNAHIRRNDTVSTPLTEGFKQLIEMVRAGQTPEALRIVFRKRDNSVRTMDVAYDVKMIDAMNGGRAEAVAQRRETNEARGNIVVRERLKDPDTGAISFQWRTIPLTRIMSVSPCL